MVILIWLAMVVCSVMIQSRTKILFTTEHTEIFLFGENKKVFSVLSVVNRFFVIVIWAGW
jgi:hypothetical protein